MCVMEKFVVLDLCLFVACFTTVIADSVPVLIWSNDRSFDLPHPLAGHTISVDDFNQRYVSPLLAHSRMNIVLFIQDKLSVDDISVNANVYGDNADHSGNYNQLKSLMSSMSVAQLPSVESPSQSLARLQEHFSADSVSLLSAPYHIADLSLDNNSNNLVIVQLPETGATGTAYSQSLSAIDEIVGSVTSYMKSLPSRFVALYTATSSSHTEQGPQQQQQPEFYAARESHSGRQLLQSADVADKPVCNITGKMLMIVENMTLLQDGVPIWALDDKYSCAASAEDCPDNGTVCLVTLHSNGDNDINAVFKLNMTKMGSSYWSVGNFMVSYKNGSTGETVEVLLDPTFVADTPINFSFHCSDPAPIQPLNKTSSGVAGVSVKFIELQIQAFGISNNQFGYYNDCTGFFTIPIWMGVITMLSMLAIVLLGIAMLLSINTMDRYDDPKGKTITVNVTD